MDKASSATVSGGWWPRLRILSSVRGRIIASFGLLVIILMAVAAGSAWQSRAHQSDLADLEQHATTASMLQEAEAQAGIAALLLQRYVIAGDETLVPEIQSHATAAVESLTGAVAQGAPAGVDEIAVQGVSLAEGAGQVVALRQSGDVQGAAAAIEQIVPVFREFRLGLEDATAEELQEVSGKRSQADETADLAFWFAVLAGAIGAAFGLAASALAARSIIKPLSSLEATAVAASQGDLSARAPATGPRELAHLGSVLNDMMAAVERHTEELRLANEELRERNRQLMDARAQAATDPLTGLGNHRTFHKRIRDEIAGAEGSGGRVGLILLDIDGFKSFNDSLGHLAGDEILRQLALTLGEVVKQEDAYRYGGDEFAVLLLGADLKKATKVAERLRVAVERMSSSNSERLTVSLGVGSFPEMAGSAEELVYRVDMAMYWAKSTGKNRVGDWDGLLSRRTGGTAPQYVSDRGTQVPDAIVALIAALAAKDPVTRTHGERCSWYTAKLAEELGLGEEEASAARLAAVLHDVGKLAMPDEVLCKPGPLDEDEWEQMRQHPTTALHMLSQIDATADATPAILHHHEHFDGSGYPDGLSGNDIPITSRILLVTDAFDAMTTDRPYRKAMPLEAAIEELKRHSGSQFDPVVVKAFLKILSRDGAHPLYSMAAAEEAPAAAGVPGEA